MTPPNAKRHLIIMGGGTAGWMTAAAFAKMMGQTLNITLLESDAIGTVGVGEATIPTLQGFHHLLGLDEATVMAATNATFKLGIQFENWRQLDHRYIHSFGYFKQDNWAASFQHFWRKGLNLGINHDIGDYCREHLAARELKFAVNPSEPNHAYHLDATLYAQLLRRFAENLGVTRLEGLCTQVELHPNTGFIQRLHLASGEVLNGDFFIDCTGFAALLIEKALHTGYHDWSHWLPCDRAVAVQTASNGDFLPYTRAIARDSGWQWRIPLQNRTGNGLVYCSRYLSDDSAIEALSQQVDGALLTEPRLIRFRTGTRMQHWNKNCVAIGLSSGFIEPLESTSIHLIQRSIVRLLQLFPSPGTEAINAQEFNQQMHDDIANIRDFIILHYKQTQRSDTPFWRYCRNMPVPEHLQHRLNLFAKSGRAYKYGSEVFGETSWVQVMLGQGLMPESYHPQVDTLTPAELTAYLQHIRTQVRQQVDALPLHKDFIQHYCPNPSLAPSTKPSMARHTPIIPQPVQEPVFFIKRIGLLQTPVIVVDHFTQDGGEQLRQAASKAEFGFDNDSYYPGIRAALPAAYVQAVLRVMQPHLREVYALAQDVPLQLRKACFSLITKPAEGLSPQQRLPHFDTTSPHFFAILHYLGEGEHGDTGFFRHKTSGFERIFPADESHYFTQLNRGLNQHPFPAEFITQDNAHFHLYDSIEYKPNRLVIYPGNLLHSTLVNPQQDISGDYRQGRLTANIFVECAAQ